jgi:hypothetical protein
MIVGNGNIGKVLHDIDRDDVIYFASGTSNSGNTDPSVFKREIDLLMSQDKTKHLVYFSALGIYRFNNDYLRHKKYCEIIIKKFFLTYTIVRIEVIEWGRNPTTIHNVMRRMISAGEEVQIRDEYRHVINLDEFMYWMRLIPIGECHEMNMTGRKYHVREIYEMVKSGKL